MLNTYPGHYLVLKLSEVAHLRTLQSPKLKCNSTDDDDCMIKTPLPSWGYKFYEHVPRQTLANLFSTFSQERGVPLYHDVQGGWIGISHNVCVKSP